MKLALFILLTLLILLGIQNSANASGTVTVSGTAEGFLGCEPGKDPSKNPSFKGSAQFAKDEALENARAECGSEVRAISEALMVGSCWKQSYFGGKGTVRATQTFECLGTPVCYWPKPNIRD